MYLNQSIIFRSDHDVIMFYSVLFQVVRVTAEDLHKVKIN